MPSGKAEEIANRIVAEQIVICAQVTQEVKHIYCLQEGYS